MRSNGGLYLLVFERATARITRSGGVERVPVRQGTPMKRALGQNPHTILIPVAAPRSSGPLLPMANLISVAEEWGLESHLFRWRSERIAANCPTSLLIVRRFAKRDAADHSPEATAEAVELASDDAG